MKSLLLKVLVPIFICSLVTLVFGEFAFRTVSRLTNSSIYWAFHYQSLMAEPAGSAASERWSLHIPSLEKSFYGHPFLTNSLGLRDSEIDSASPGNLLWLGSSVALGWGLPEEKRLSTLLKSKFLPLKIVNAGVANHRAAEHFQTYEFLKSHVRPKQVILMLHPNDVLPVGPRSPRWLRHSLLLASLYTVGSNYFSSKEETTMNLEWLIRLARACEQDQVPFKILIPPELAGTGPEMDRGLDNLVEQIKQVRILVDVVPVSALGKHQNLLKNLWITPQDPHGNAEYQELVARYLIENSAP